KSMALGSHNIDGLVGISIHTDDGRDETHKLIIDTTLSTLLNLVASVKAIYKYTKDLEYYATRDPLTNLYNQRLFWELLDNEVHRAERHGYPFSLLVIDLDNFKSLNDSYGHSFGDQFLIEFSNTVQQSLRTDDILARYGGDEFVVILPEADIQQAQMVAERVIDYVSLQNITDPQGNPVKGSVSIGVAVYPEHATDMKDLFLFADNMMYKAKAEGKNRVSLPTEEEVLSIFRNIGEKSIIISNAIEEKRIIPHFQPILDVQNNCVAAVEVLCRIKLKDGTMLGAHEFIEIAEKMGVINQLDHVVMECAFQKIHDSSYHGLIFLNLSPRNLVRGEFISQTKSLAEKFKIPLENIVLEITERDTVHNIDTLEKNLHRLKQEGFKLAIDDFGSGFSSFHYLKRFPVDIVKIEGDFIRNMTHDPRDAAFVKSITNLAHELKIEVVAEYVENEDILNHVREAGIKFAQGNLIGKPDKSPVCNDATCKICAQ
ncbi:MAG: bifunctional diguanylate cyclase/phosphodiesterase, partial [Gammaproteobacteria bacterium]|nr:bifunctional diguanylate cyclase/phosphodiesterase [Gammaproteobacteria bacterium]